MEILGNDRINNTTKIICALLIAGMVAVAIAVYGAHVTSMLAFAFFVIFYLQLPGQFILKAIGFKADHISSDLCLGFFTGWAFIVFQYFLTELIGTNAILYALGPLCSLLYFVISHRQHRLGQPFTFDIKKVSTALMIFLVIAFAYSMLENQFLYLDPAIDEMTCTNPDRAFHIGLINTLSYGFPMESPWMSGTYYYYHIFSEMVMSVPVRLFSLPADQVLFSCGPLFTVYAFGTSLYAFFREMTVKKERAGLYCMALVMSNIFLARSIKTSIAFVFVFGNENVAGYAASCSFAFLILMKYWYDSYSKGNPWIGQFILLLAFMMLLTGVKGPFGLTALAGLWGAFLLGLIMRKLSFRMVVPLLILSIGFYLIYVVVLGSKGQSGVGESPFGLARILGITFFKSPLILWMKSHGIPLIVRYGVLLLTFTIFMLTAFFLPFVAGYVRELILVFSGKREFYFPRIVVYAVFIAGFIAMMILRFNGRSQIYFGFLPVFLAVLIAFWFFEDMEDNKGIWMKLVRGIFCVSLALCTVSLCFSIAGKISPAVNSTDPSRPHDPYLSVTQEEYEGMRWIRDNTPEDSLLAIDRYYSVDPAKYEVFNRWDNRFFLYADYADRICYLGGTGYTLPSRKWGQRVDRIKKNDMLYDPGNEDRGNLAKQLGVDYVVVSKNFTHIPDLAGNGYKLCYSNDDIDVYEIQ